MAAMQSKDILQTAYATDPGLVREHNEDTVAVDERLGVIALADGMGGYQAGEIASEIAVSRIMRELSAGLRNAEPKQMDPVSGYRAATLLLQDAVYKANQAIFTNASEKPERHGMGTTVVAAVFYEDYISFAHVGDSRLYRLRKHRLQQLTTDHSVLQELIEQGYYTPEEARRSPNKNLVTRALGVQAEVVVEVQENRTEKGDLYLLCSDGLNDMLEDNLIQSIINSDTNLNKVASKLIKAANAQGGKDNISVVLAAPLAVPAPRTQSLWRRLLRL